ncbi:OmpP1/FadL family transporter [Salinibacter altiplanensis]|uniref:OmpP1/FadL family transporter n=1 Tax=Salinibacter altiplanensis TaxID=1803181 RepID=UPI001F1DA4CE|nr:outer membrane protein transport protein [Salinibacter altiplanensis]
MPSFLPLRFLSAVLALLVVVGLGSTPHTLAQGFGVYEQSSCVMARAGATVADGCGDGSSIYFNPAHLAGADGVTASVGATLIDVGGDFTYDPGTPRATTQEEVDLENDVIPVPHAYLTYGLTEKIGLGLGTYVPYGLETQWPTQLSDGAVFDGAFEGFDNQLQSFYVQPSIAYQVTPKLKIGGGPVFVVSSVELNQFQDLSQTETPGGGPTFGQLGVPFHTAFARTKLDADNEFGIGGNIGVSYQATDRVMFGVRYTTPVTVEYEGEATFEQVETGLVFPSSSPLARDLPTDGNQDENPDPTPADLLLASQFGGNGVLEQFSNQADEEGALNSQSVETEITFPMQLVAGVSVQATDRLLLLADYQFTGWSSFDELPLEFGRLDNRTRIEDYEDTHAVRLGGEYDLLDRLTVRTGYLFNTDAVPDQTVTTLLPESERNQFTIGLGWHATDAVELNVSYQRLVQNDRRGRVRGARPEEELSTDLNQGLYSFGANLFGTTLTLHL